MVRLSRLRISRCRARSAGGTIGLAGCGSAPAPTGTAAPATTGDLVALLDSASTRALAQDETQGPYWFDVDDVRSDIREDRPGTELTLALRVHDARCAAGGAPLPRADRRGWSSARRGPGGDPRPSATEPAAGRATGRPADRVAPRGAGVPGGSGETSDGSYSAGDREATTTDDGTYLRGAQVADARGIVQFTTVFPGLVGWAGANVTWWSSGPGRTATTFRPCPGRQPSGPAPCPTGAVRSGDRA